MFFSDVRYTQQMYILVAWNLKKNYLQAIKGMITDHPLFLSLGFFFLLTFWIARLHTVLNSFSPLPTGFSRWRGMSTAFGANAL